MRVRLVAVGPGSDGFAVRMSRSCAKKLGLRNSKSVTVSVGSCAVDARLVITAGSSQHVMGLSKPLAAKLRLPMRIQLHAKMSGGVLRIGPIVGILMPATGARPYPFGNMTLEAGYYVETGRQAGVYPIAFTAKGIDFAKGVVRGYTCTGGQVWVRKTVPLPDVVYDHVTVRSRDKSPVVRDLRKKLDQAGIPYFNPGFFDKWEVHSWLSKCPEVQDNLPDTYPLTLENLSLATQKYKRLFIKPAQGSLGRNIVVLTQASDGTWEFRRAAGKASGKEQAQTLEEVIAKLPKLTNDEYIIQQGLDLSTSGGRPVDVRVLMQRNGSGSWRITKIFARVARRGRLVANITRGGKGIPAGRALRRQFSGGRTRKALVGIRRLAYRVCRCLEKVVEKPIGEVGVDIGVDKRGHVWVIEVNSKPHRKAYDTLEGRPGARRSFQRPMLYAAYLAGFGRKK